MQPIKVEIKNLSGVVTNAGSFETLEEANTWIEKQETKPRPWNFPKDGEYLELPHGAVNYTEEDREVEFSPAVEAHEAPVYNELGEPTGETISVPASPAVTRVQHLYIVPKQYTVEVIDRANDYGFQMSLCYEKRKAEYPSFDEIVEALIEDDHDKLQAIRDYRQTIKQKHPKPVK